MSVGRKLRITALSTLVIVVLLVLSAAGLLSYSMVNQRANFESVEAAETYDLDSRNVTLQTSDGLNIDAYEVKTSNPKGYIIILSGIYSPSVTAFYGYAKMFQGEGYSSILVEMRAHGKSDGNKIMLGYTEQGDVDAAVEYIDAGYAGLPIVVLGTSMGGVVAINSAANNDRINGVISQSAYSSWEENMQDQFEASGTPRLIAQTQIPFTRLLLGAKYGFANIKNTPSNNIGRINPRKILLMHSTGDSQVNYANFERLKNGTSAPIDFYTVEGDKHFIVDEDQFGNPKADREYYLAIKAFLDKVS